MRLNKKYILFDMDGTITDSKPGILNSMRHAMRGFGVEIPDSELESYSFFLGPPLRDSFRALKIKFKLDNMSEKAAVAKYREYYVPTGMFENSLYPGIEELLKSLKNSGKIIILATSKAEKYAKMILERFKISNYFDLTVGSELDGRRSDKSEVILYALNQYGLVSPEKKQQAVMIGDRNHDIIGAAAAGITSVGVLYGYGSLEELTAGEYKAGYTAKDAAGLAGILL